MTFALLDYRSRHPLHFLTLSSNVFLRDVSQAHYGRNVFLSCTVALFYSGFTFQIIFLNCIEAMFHKNVHSHELANYSLWNRHDHHRNSHTLVVNLWLRKKNPCGKAYFFKTVSVFYSCLLMPRLNQDRNNRLWEEFIFEVIFEVVSQVPDPLVMTAALIQLETYHPESIHDK